jgi:glutathione S-transferase
MALTLHFHPFSSFCQKVLIALYENDTAFERRIVDLTDAEESAAFRRLWPIGKFPVLYDDAGALTIPESTIIIEYLALHYPGANRLIPADPDLARECRARDRFYDWHVHLHMQTLVGDRLRPAEKRDPFGVAQAKSRLETAFGMIDAEMAAKTWAMGDAFTMADCAAAPALYYANLVLPFAQTHKHVAAYLDRLTARPSFARTVKEAEPYRAFFPS